MANTVPLITKPSPAEQRVIEFRGLNRKPQVEEGEMSDMLNLTSDSAPLLRPRQLRGEMTLPESVKKPISIITKYERIAMIAKKTDDSIAFYYDGNAITSVTGLTADTEMVAINNKICFFPQKTFLQIDRSGSDSYAIGIYGSFNATLENVNKAVLISNKDARIALLSDIGDLKDKDAVNLSGTLSYTSESVSKTVDCTVSCIIDRIETIGGSGIVPTTYTMVLPANTFIELVGSGVTTAQFNGTIKRECPDIHHVVEWNNRLWGVSDETNTIYACKLGDPTNWQYFQGTGMDSYYAEQGTDEKWTGVAKYSGHIIFFKPNSMTKVYGTSPSNFQVTNTVCYGVEPRSSNSVAIVNDTVFYKSSIGIMAYDGGTPYGISDKFNCKFGEVVGGTEGRKYYASIKTESDEYELMVLDVEKAVWHKEDGIRFTDCCTLGAKLYFICEEDYGSFSEGHIYIANPDTATELIGDRKWMAVFGPFDEYVEDQKIYSKMSLRFLADPGAKVSVFIKMDDGPWETVKKFEYAKTGGEEMRIVPRRCDRFSIKISGKGNCEIKSLTRRFRRGSGVKHDNRV